MGRILDWLDEISGYDRTSLRVIGAIIIGLTLLIAAERGINELTDKDCDSNCQQVAEDFMRENAPGLFVSPTPFNPDRFIDDTLRN